MRTNVAPLTVGPLPKARTRSKFGHALAAVLFAFAARADAAAPPDGVLVIHSNQRPTPAAVIIDDTLRKVVPDALKRPVEIYSEYLDIERFAVETYAGAGAEFLRQKYAERNIRVIVASAPQAVALRDRNFATALFPACRWFTSPCRATNWNACRSRPMSSAGPSISIRRTTLELAFRLHPDAKRLVVVVGAAERDRIWEQRVRGAVARLERQPEVEYLSGLPTPDVLRRLAGTEQGDDRLHAGLLRRWRRST